MNQYETYLKPYILRRYLFSKRTPMFDPYLQNAKVATLNSDRREQYTIDISFNLKIFNIPNISNSPARYY
jgi:hypothetical protein